MSKEYDDDYDDDGFDNENLPAKKNDDQQTNELLAQTMAMLAQTLASMSNNVIDTKTEVQDIDTRLTKVEQRSEVTLIEDEHEAQLHDAVNERVIRLLGDRYSNDYKRYSRYLYKRIWGELNNYCGVVRCRQIKESQYEKAMEFVTRYVPAEGMAAFKYDVDRRR